MYITSQSLRALTWATLALSTAQAQYIIDNLSFGHRDGTISPNLRAIPHYHTAGEGYTPEILSDRVILTPPYPGNKRGALFAEDPLNHQDWTAELSFRASGIERGGGNLQLWYTKDSQKNEVPSSLYTAPKFDGLVLLVDQYEGRGGSVRGFLNDGTIDIKSHHDPDTLAFGQCNYAYRNLGRLSVLKLKQSGNNFEVTVDGNSCFNTDKIKLPQGYYFGISAASAENPDSFEVNKFIVETTTTEQPVVSGQGEQSQRPMGHRHQEETSSPWKQQPPQNTKQQVTPGDIPSMLSDVLAGSIKSQEDQFADLHNRVQDLNHRVQNIYEMLDRVDRESKERFASLMNRLVPTDDRTSAMMRNVEKVERISMEIQRDLESKDFRDMLNAVHNAIQDNNALSAGIPLQMATIVTQNKHSLTTFLFAAIAVQIMVVGAYMLYKKRRNSAPKKYL